MIQRSLYKGRWPTVYARDLVRMAEIRGKGPEPEVAEAMRVRWGFRYMQQHIEGWTET